MADRQQLVAELAREEAQLRDLRREMEARSARIAELRDHLSAAERRDRAVVSTGVLPSPAPTSAVPAPTPTTNPAKVALFRALFRGRADVFPRRWENEQKGTSGYSPACTNEWAWGLCEKKKGRGAGRRASCGECPNQAFVPVSAAEVTRHLRGEQVMGVYPLLPDETCWFLAADFDKASWQEDIAAFAQTCALFDVPVAVERSRSGNGAHAWLFFASPVPATVARKLGCFLITETMSRRHELSMASYDRLFPNQDTMPRGGFGNLIALPLQRGPRDAGNSVFVEPATLHPWPDQWAFLAGVQRLEPSTVLTLAEEASRRGQVVGVRMSDALDEDERAPWLRPPSGRVRKVSITEPVPATVKAVLSQRLFVEKAGLPSPLINQLKRLAAFQNPDFYKKQSMRLSTALTPRVIACAEDFPDHVALPRGCQEDAESLLRALGSSLDVQDEREEGDEAAFTFRGELTPLQEAAVEALLGHDIGVFVAPPGVGKTVVGTYLVGARRRRTLILVHRKPLLDQWVNQLSAFLGISPKDVGQIGGGKSKPNGRLDVAMVQSLVRKGAVSDLVAGYGQVILDEAHHCPAVSFERVLAEVKAKYLVGLTATPTRRDGHQPILHMQLGPVRYAVDPKNQAARRPFEHTLVVRETSFSSAHLADKGIQEIYAALAADESRNDLIFDDVVHALAEGRSPILLTERRDHLEYLAERLRGFTRHLVVLQGGMKARERRDVLAQLAAIPDEEERLLIATGRYIGEGFDDARLDTLFLALPVSWKGTLVQYAGRLHRLHPRKTEVRVYDYVDRAVPMLERMFEKRLRGYRSMGYDQERVLDDPQATNDELELEYGRENEADVGEHQQ